MMNRKTLIRMALWVACLAPASGAAQHALEVITLEHRTAEQVLPALQPLLEPGATLSGQSNQIIVRTSPANLADLRLALEALDRPARRLQISVRFDEAREASRTRIEAGGRVDEHGARARVQARTIQRRGEERIDQRVQVLEGSRAVIYTGRERPVRQYIQTPGGVIPQQVTIVQDKTTGFAVVPRLSGSMVVLDLGEGHSVSAELGQWIELGRSSSAARYRTELQGVWLKVDELPR